VILGQERVAICQDCRTPSTADLAGLAAFRLVIRGGVAIEVCRCCAESASKTLRAQIFPSSSAAPGRSELV